LQEKIKIKTICDELIEQMGRKVRFAIVDEIKATKYYSISVDSTQDISHIDQLTFIVRYVTQSGKPVEQLKKFVDIHGHGAANLAEVVTNIIMLSCKLVTAEDKVMTTRPI